MEIGIASFVGQASGALFLVVKRLAGLCRGALESLLGGRMLGSFRRVEVALASPPRTRHRRPG